jgi:hypothetical protein
LYWQEIGLAQDVELRHGGRGRQCIREAGDAEQSEGSGDCQGFYAHQHLLDEPYLTEAELTKSAR